jgi:hypothetical protein
MGWPSEDAPIHIDGGRCNLLIGPGGAKQERDISPESHATNQIHCP